MKEIDLSSSELDDVKNVPKEKLEVYLFLLGQNKLEVLYKKVTSVLNQKFRAELIPTGSERMFQAFLKSLSRFQFISGYWIGRNCIDIFLPRYGLIIEIDGSVHNKLFKMRQDKFRDDYFYSLKLPVIHIDNKDILRGASIIVEAIRHGRIKRLDTRAKNRRLVEVYIETIIRNIELL